MHEIVNRTLNMLAQTKASFADVRLTATDGECFRFERGALKDYSVSANSRSLGVRVLADGCWGFCGTNELDDFSIGLAVKKAMESALLGAKFKKDRVSCPGAKALRESFVFNPVIDPFGMDRDEKMQDLLALARMLEGHEKIIHSFLYAEFFRQKKYYASTEGVFCDSTAFHALPYLGVLSSDGGKVLTRSFPGHMSAKMGGYEVLKEYAFEENIPVIIKEAVDLLDAPAMEEGRADIIIGGGHLALQIHESVGHATEADRIFGMEISYAGKTFVKPEMLGKFRYGSALVNIVSDTADNAGMGFAPVDDEGIPCRRTDIIKGGVLVGLQTSRETAARLGLEPSSNMKASFGGDFPVIRMTNFNLLPGESGSLRDLVKSTEKGYLLDFTKCWSIDDNRYNFQFTTEIGYRIRDGEIKGIVREPTYCGITPEFWNSCDAICGESEWKYYGTFTCGKAEPGQLMHLSHKTAPARFRNVACSGS